MSKETVKVAQCCKSMLASFPGASMLASFPGEKEATTVLILWSASHIELALLSPGISWTDNWPQVGYRGGSRNIEGGHIVWVYAYTWRDQMGCAQMQIVIQWRPREVHGFFFQWSLWCMTSCSCSACGQTFRSSDYWSNYLVIGSVGPASFPCFSLRFGICEDWVTYNTGSSTYKHRQEKEQNPRFVVWMPVLTSATNVGLRPSPLSQAG